MLLCILVYRSEFQTKPQSIQSAPLEFFPTRKQRARDECHELG